MMTRTIKIMLFVVVVVVFSWSLLRSVTRSKSVDYVLGDILVRGSINRSRIVINKELTFQGQTLFVHVV